jgi:hypothetical protein
VNDLLRVYLDPAEIGQDGYPYAWHGKPVPLRPYYDGAIDRLVSIKDYVRELTGHRCVRCGHPYVTGTHGRGEWSPCDELCDHGGPFRLRVIDEEYDLEHTISFTPDASLDWILATEGTLPEAQWRILTVHHLNGVKHDCRWWNLAALCQRCHLSIQGRVLMERVYPLEHSDWFKPYAAGWYAWAYLGEELTREQTLARLDELLALERAA